MIPCAGTQEDSSSEHESSSDITLQEADEAEWHFFPSEPVTPCIDDSEASHPPFLFPFHLISGCSTAERSMCQYSRSMTAQEVRSKVVVKGTLTEWDAWPPHASLDGWTLFFRHRSAPTGAIHDTTRHAGTAFTTADEARLTAP
jgi:hypothetical protein